MSNKEINAIIAKYNEEHDVPVECECCKTVVCFARVHGRAIRYVRWIDGGSQSGESQKYPGKLAVFCAEHSPNDLKEIQP